MNKQLVNTNMTVAAHVLGYGDGEWLTARELADIKLAGLPATARAFQIMAKRENWKNLGSEKARKRKGRGGGWEYHISCLPAEAQADWVQRQKTTETEIVLEKREVSAQKTTEELATNVAAHRRNVMEARAAVLRELDRRRFITGSKIDATIAEMIAEARAGICEQWLLDIFRTASDRTRSRPRSASTGHTCAAAPARHTSTKCSARC